jgi:hypothetical protein
MLHQNPTDVITDVHHKPIKKLMLVLVLLVLNW